MSTAGNDCTTDAHGGSVTNLAIEISAQPSEVGRARRAVAEHLIRHGVPSVVVDDVELLTSELVTNAIIHPPQPGPVQLAVRVDQHLVVAVSNVGSVERIPPVESWRPAPPSAVSGRGLGIVRRLCDDIVVEQVGDRAVVTCRRVLPDGGGGGGGR